jgi:hypothetical protein
MIIKMQTKLCQRKLNCHKNPIKDRWPEPSPRRKKGKAKERPKDAQPIGTKKRETIIYLTHIPSNVTYMQIVRFYNNGRSRTSMIANIMFF